MLPEMNYALRKLETSQKWAFLGRHVELVITACPTYYFPPLSTEQPISAPQPQPQARHSG